MSEILREHLDAARVASPKVKERLARDLTAECYELDEFLTSISKVGALSPESEDRIVSVGEKLSAQYLAALLDDYGMEAEYVDLSDVINFKVLHGLDKDFYQDLAQAIGKRVQLCGDKVPV